MRVYHSSLFASLLLFCTSKCVFAVHKGTHIQISRAPFIAYCEGSDNSAIVHRFVGTILNQKTILTSAYFCKSLTEIRVYVGTAIPRGSSIHYAVRFAYKGDFCVMAVSPYLLFDQNVQKAAFSVPRDKTTKLPKSLHVAGWGLDEYGINNGILTMAEFTVSTVVGTGSFRMRDTTKKARLDVGDGGAPAFEMDSFMVWGIMHITGKTMSLETEGNLTGIHMAWIHKARDQF